MPASYRAARGSPAATGARRAHRAGGRARPSAARARARTSAGAPGASASEPASALRRCANAAATSSRRSGSGAGPVRCEPDEHGVDVGHRREHRARHRAQDLHVAGELGEHRRQPVGARAGPGGEALADLLLDHPDPAPHVVELLDRAQDGARRDAVGQVGDDLRRRRRQRAQVELHRVGEVQRDVGERVDGVAQRRLERAVELDDVDVRDARREVLREHAEAAADLEHDVVGLEPRLALDHAEDVGVDEEVLAEVALGPHAEVAHPAQARLRRRARGVTVRRVTGSARRIRPAHHAAARRRCARRAARAPRTRSRAARRRSAPCGRRTRAGCAPCARPAA